MNFKIIGSIKIYSNSKRNLSIRIGHNLIESECSTELPNQNLLELTDIDQVYRVLKHAGENKNVNNIAADKSVQNTGKDGLSQSDIPIVNVPEYPERSDRPTVMGAASSSAGGRGARSGVRPPPVHMPILGVQLQQQELSQQWSGAISSSTGGGLPVPVQDISSSSGPP